MLIRCATTGLLAFVSISIVFAISPILHSSPSLWRGGTEQDPPTRNLFEKTGTIKSEKIVESSGLAFSFRTKDVVFTHNDSGHGANLFAVSLSGAILREFEIKGGRNVDWEAMTSFSIENQPYLLIADVGDNLAKRENYQLYIFSEPETGKAVEKANRPDAETPIGISSKKLDFEYEDGPKNCEAIGVDPISKDIWMVEKVYFDAKQTNPPGIYVLPMPLHEGSNASGQDTTKANQKPNSNKPKQRENKRRNTKQRTAKRIGDFNVRNVTGMAFSPDGNRLIIRNYLNAHLYQRSTENSWRKTISTSKPIPIPLPLQRQGEAICFTPDSRSLIVSSEMRRQALWKVDLDGYLASRIKEAAQPPAATIDEKSK